MVDGEAVGGVNVVQNPSCLISHERLQSHSEHSGLLYRTYSPSFESYGLDCPAVEENRLVQEANLIPMVR